MKLFPRLRTRRFRFVPALLAALLLAGPAPRALAALIEEHTPVTYNMQGSSAANQSKWTTDVLPLSNTHDIVALQEAGPAPPGNTISQYTTAEGQVTETLWSVGTSAAPSYRYVYFLQTDPTGNRVNLAIVTRVGADDVTTIPAGIAGASRGALGVRLGEVWFFSIHGLSGGGNDDAGLLRNIESANLYGLFWAALGDFNRDPNALVTPSDATIYHPGQSTQQSGGELDYMVSNDVVECPPEDLEVTARVLGGLSSDHYPVDFPVRPCSGNGGTSIAPLALMSVGDQVVVGSSASPTSTNSYRGDLQNDLSGDGFSWNFVGTQQSGDLSDPYHEGYNYDRIDQLDQKVVPSIRSIQPNLITVLAGGEDISENYQLDTAPSRLASMVEDFFNTDPGVTILVATAPPPFLSSSIPATEAFNNKLPRLVQNEQQHGRHILLTDLGSLSATDFLFPLANAFGYQTIADAFNTDILTAISLGWLAHPNPCSSGSCGPSGESGGGGGISGRLLPSVCDIYASGGTPCVAAHSTVRALFENYSGNLYQVMRASDGTSMDIEVLSSSGYADAAKQDSFCAGTSCTITKIYDQTVQHNDLGIEGPGGTVTTGDSGAVADALPITVNGNKAYGISVTSGVGYRNNATSGVAKGSSPEGLYMVTSGTNVNGAGSVNGGCCFDYGNGEANSTDNGNGHMDAINFSTFCTFPPCSGSGPWVEADLENGLFQGNGSNPANQTINSNFVTAMLKNDGKTTFALKGGNSQSGGLTTEYSGSLPTSGGYIPMSLEGGIMLGTGGDNSDWGIGSFFEGAMTSGYPTDATEDAVQANIVAAGYSGSSNPGPGSGGGSGSGSGGGGEPGFPDVGGTVYTGPSDPGGPGPQDGFGSPATEQPNDLMASRPAMAAFQGNLYVAFQGVNADNNLYITRSLTGTNFPTAGRYTNIRTASAPAMAEFNNRLFVAFQGVNANNNFYVTSSTDGANFPEATRYTNILIGSAPALAVFNNQLYAAFQANDPGHTLHITSSSDGTTWPTAWQIPNVLIGSAPSMAAFNGKLYVAFRANDASDNLYIASSSDGIHFTSQALAGQLMGGHSAPALVASYNTLYCIYGASDSSHEMLVTASTDGATWQGPKAYLDDHLGPAGPAAAAFDNGVYVGFQSNDSRNVLFVTANVPPQASVYTGPNDPNGPGPQDGFMSPAVSQSGDTMATKPALAYFNQSLYVAFQGVNANETLYVARTDSGLFPGATRYTKIQIGSAPAMAAFNNQLYIAFQADDASHTFFVTSSGDGTTFPAATGYPNIKIGSAPALAKFNNQLYAGFQADDPGHTLFLTSSSNGMTWPTAYPIPNVQIGSAPAMAVFKNRLYVAFRANDPSDTAFIASSSDGVNFSSEPLSGQHMGWRSAPALVATNNTLYYIYGADDISNEMLVSASTDGSTWQGPAVYPGVQMGGTGPAAALFGILGINVAFQSNDSGNVLFMTGDPTP